MTDPTPRVGDTVRLLSGDDSDHVTHALVVGVAARTLRVSVTGAVIAVRRDGSAGPHGYALEVTP